MKTIIALAVSLLALSVAATAQCVPATPSDVPGIANFAQVSPRVFRGAQPTEEGFKYLRKRGVSIDIDLRSGYQQAEGERVLAELNGMYFVHIYWRAWPWFFVPNKRDVQDALEIIANNPKARVFVHCRQGRDRTGVVIAAYRIESEGCSANMAVHEMRTFRFHEHMFPRWLWWVESL